MENKKPKFDVNTSDKAIEYDDVTATKTIFYAIERTIKQYRKYAQHQFDQKIGDITVDQAMVLSFVENDPDLSQSQIAALVFKDNASVTRMIDLLKKKGYLKRGINHSDRRRFSLKLTPAAKKIMYELRTIRNLNRATALNGISAEQLSQFSGMLEKLTINCKIDD